MKHKVKLTDAASINDSADKVKTISDDQVPANEVDLETVLSKIKLSDWYYLKCIVLILFTTVNSGFFALNYVFTAAEVDYRCKYTECENNISSISNIHFNWTLNEGRCNRYALNDNNCTMDSFNTTVLIKCDEWVYADPYSLVAEFNLACQEWKRTLVGSSREFGHLIGLLIVGPVSDRFGRKTIIITYGLIAVVLGLSKSIMVVYWAFIALSLVESMIGDNYSPLYVLSAEMVSKDKLPAINAILSIGFSMAGVITPLIAWLVPYWRHMLLIIYIPPILFATFYFLLDESFRWLLSKGREQDAVRILKRITADRKPFSNIKYEKPQADVTFIKLLKITLSSKKLLLRFVICVCMWMTCAFNYFSLTLNSVSLIGNKYINFALSSLTEIPAHLASQPVLEKCKRKPAFISCFLLTGLCCSIYPFMLEFVPKEYNWISTAVYLAGKFVATLSFSILHVYTAELFPTYTRNTMHAMCSSLGRCGSVLATQTPLLIKYWKGLPSVIVACLSIWTAMITMFMPDTGDVALPENVHQAEAIGSKKIEENSVCNTRF